MKCSLFLGVVYMLSILFSVNLYANSLSEISQFSKEVCDDIQASGSRNISKTDIETKLKGNIGRVAKMIGVDVGANGELTIGETQEEYEGLPYESISEQMRDSRLCKLQISRMLIQERKKVIKRLDDKQLSSREFEVKEISRDYQKLKDKFIAYADKEEKIENVKNLPLGIFNKDSYSKNIRGKLETMDGQMQSMLLVMSFMPILQEIQEGIKIMSQSIKNYYIHQSGEYLSLKNEADALGQRTQAVLFEMLDLMQKAAR